MCEDPGLAVPLDRVLAQLGSFGRQQVRALCLLALVYCTNSMYNVNYVFVVQEVSFRCRIPECESSGMTESSWLNFTIPPETRCTKYSTLGNSSVCSPQHYDNYAVETCSDFVYSEPDSFVAEFNLGCEEWKQTLVGTIHCFGSMVGLMFQGQISDRCRIPECESSGMTESSWLNFTIPPETRCTKYSTLGNSSVCSPQHYDNYAVETCSDFVYSEPDSFVAEFNLGCEEWKQTLVGTIHCFGSMVGLMFQGQISDSFGRKKAAVFAGTTGALLGLAKSYSTSYWLYIVLEGLEAAIGDALSPIFMLSIEIVPKRSTILFQMILLNCYTGGLMLMSLLAWGFPYWRHFLRIIYAPTLIMILYPLLLDESIRWLFSKGRREEGIRLIKKAAKRNGVKIEPMMLNKLEYIEEKEEPTDLKKDRKLLLKTFKSKIMMQRFLVCLVWWFTITLINYGMMISSVLIAGNKYVNFALLMLMDIPANVLYWLVLVRHKRKTTLLVSFLIGGVFCVCQPFVPEDYNWLAVALFMSFELLATFSYNIVYMYTSELFPTYTRNSMHAICSSVGRVGSLLAPQIPLLMSYWSGLPTLIFGVTSLASGMLTVFMPETRDSQLPDTVREAEDIGRKTTVRKEEIMHKKTDESEPTLIST